MQAKMAFNGVLGELLASSTGVSYKYVVRLRLIFFSAHNAAATRTLYRRPANAK